MDNQRLTFTVKTNNGLTRVAGTVVAPNIAYHRPVGYPSHYDRRPSDGDVWDLSQVSSGMQIGRFQTIEAATFYGEVAAKVSPNLVAGSPLTKPETDALAQLRTDCGGWRN